MHLLKNILICLVYELPPELLNKRTLDSESAKKIDYLIQIIKFLAGSEKLKTNFYINGNILSYLDKKIADFSNTVRTLIEKNSLELLSGGYYEPIFSLIPKDDRQNQILLTNRSINHIFGYTPSGLWLTQFPWDPSIIVDLNKSKIDYTFLPAEYFTSSDNSNNISGYYITEEDARKIAIYPINMCLKKLMNELSPEEALSKITNENLDINTIFLNEPISNDSELKWLLEFFHLIEVNEDIKSNLFKDNFHSSKPKGTIYLTSKNASKESLVKFKEVNLLHKKMLRVSKKINSAKEGKSRFKVIKEMISQAQDLLLQGQIYYPYTSQIHSTNLVQSTYSNLIKAENLIDISSRNTSKWIQVSELDYDCDGNDEIIIESETQNIYISPSLGGSILEHDYRSKNTNLSYIASRSAEIDSEKIHSVEQVASKSLNKDSSTITIEKVSKAINQEKQNTHITFGLIEHFSKNNFNLDSFHKTNLNHYQIEKIKAKEESCKVSLITNVFIEKNELEIKKQISSRSGDSSLVIDYEITNKSSEPCEFSMGVEFNLSIFNDKVDNCFIYLEGNRNNKSNNPSLMENEEIKSIKQISIHNKSVLSDISLSWNVESDLLRSPLKSDTEVNNGITLLPIWKIKIEPNSLWNLSIKQDILSNLNYEG